MGFFKNLKSYFWFGEEEKDTKCHGFKYKSKDASGASLLTDANVTVNIRNHPEVYRCMKEAEPLCQAHYCAEHCSSLCNSTCQFKQTGYENIAKGIRESVVNAKFKKDSPA